jgi:hypothetical protein
MAVIGTLKLHNTGAFVARLGAEWKDQSGKEGGFYDPEEDIREGHYGSLDPGNYGCPEGAAVWAYGEVVWGKSRHGSEEDGLIYNKGDQQVGEYHIHGSTQDSHMSFEGVQRPEQDG